MPTKAPTSILAEFQQELCGNWKNLDFGIDEQGNPVGGEDNPLSYNIMPLPQTADPDGYILKNFKYHERLHFNDDKVATTLAISARAPNRGGQVNQDARALFYEQQVIFGEGPAKGSVVHVENGAWLWFPRFIQQTGPYPLDAPGDEVSDALQQQPDISIAKQISVPHGNSILALGNFDTIPQKNGDAGAWRGSAILPGSPAIPDGNPPYPMPAVPEPVPDGTPIPSVLKSNLNADERYSKTRVSSPGDPNDFQNPHPDLTQYPNLPLQMAVQLITPTSYMHWRVTTMKLPNGKGIVTNIPFERSVSEVTDYTAEYWLLFKDDKKYLSYTQTIFMKLTIPEKETERVKRYIFPHITCNTVTYEGEAKASKMPPRHVVASQISSRPDEK